ncbi:hypothetical protein GA0115240_13476 [Streptomyces sp. DvalAA-14]|uniref:hypothetical protein n=1 Tax=unclassified Streptomyces TaxID=2593676 RepID=UPI00081AF845|nr:MULTISPECIES: hypothetical protein [unclassified Streptomyces]MYS21706.1 hypothetical protein [Streptomyces sp. SID4948]SCD99355.1 hypothetical protein GA0115240_13476 [Streptomyces sp. DvalAA-14]
MTLPVHVVAVPDAAETTDGAPDETLQYLAAYLALLDEIVGDSADNEEMLARLRATPEGVAGALELVTTGIPAAFRPEKAEGETGRVLFVIDTDTEQIRLCFEFLPDRCEAVPITDEFATTVRIGVADFLKIAFKYLDGNDAYLNGLTEVTGDVFIATNLDQWFDRPSTDMADMISSMTADSGF